LEHGCANAIIAPLEAGGYALGEMLAAGLQMAHRELLLFAVVGLAIGGIDDLLMDLLFLGRKCWRDVAIYARFPRMTTATLPASPASGPIAIFIPAWREAEVIGPMLRHALGRWRTGDYRIFVGVYPNDADTIDAVAAVAQGQERIIVAVNPRPGPTTKADCLNTVWQAMVAQEARQGRPFKAVVLHDSEHVVAVVNRLATQSRVGRIYGQAHHGYNSCFRNEARLPVCAV
jgi:adsorption protein B